MSGLGSEAPFPAFSHSPPPHCYLFDLQLPQQFLSQSFCINFSLPISSSFRSQLRGPSSSTVTPAPQALSRHHLDLFSSVFLSLWFFFFSLVYHLSPSTSKNMSPRRTLFALPCSWLCIPGCVCRSHHWATLPGLWSCSLFHTTLHTTRRANPSPSHTPAENASSLAPTSPQASGCAAHHPPPQLAPQTTFCPGLGDSAFSRSSV